MKYYEIGQRIRRYRKACGLSQEALAEKTGVSATHMSHIETGADGCSALRHPTIFQDGCVGTHTESA